MFFKPKTASEVTANISLKQIKMGVKDFFQYPANSNDENTLFYITDIELKDIDCDRTQVIIYTHFPGTLIGKNGSIIKKLSSFLSIKTDTSININVKETNLWRD